MPEELAELDLLEGDDPLESDWHVAAMNLLINTLRYLWRNRKDVYVSGNTAVYFDPQHSKRRNFRGPDLYVVKDTQKRPRQSWTTWEEGDLAPDFILELASVSTAQFDRVEKKNIYEQRLQTPEYIIYDPITNQFQGWRLRSGRYESMVANEQGQLWCEELGLWLGIASYDFDDGAGLVSTPRFFESTGQLVPTKEEMQARRAAVEAEARWVAEAEIIRLKALLAKQS